MGFRSGIQSDPTPWASIVNASGLVEECPGVDRVVALAANDAVKGAFPGLPINGLEGPPVVPGSNQIDTIAYGADDWHAATFV